MFGLVKQYKPFKIRTFNDPKKYGVAARTLKELLKKACKQLQVPLAGAHVCLYTDGTEVMEEYFPSVPDDTELVVLCREETWSGAVCDVGRLLSSDRHADRLIQAAKTLLSDERSPKRRKILTELLLSLQDTSELESREEDEDWFKGIDVRFKTKSAYMNFNCGSRIRGYMKEMDDAAKTIRKPKVRAEFTKMTKCLMDLLKSAKYNGCYFDRTEKEADRLCTEQGWFTCQGSFDQEVCPSLHSINPYSSRESRIIFSTWNLDHRIEKKRTILPALLDATQNHKSGDVNLNYFYRLLFTRENLKLVHIVCHKKGAHNLLCDGQEIFKPAKRHDQAKHKTKQKRVRIA
ncbi:hypothetical protein LDENG_00154390 [Lucifuga dentata]|nr:hypothetical protein LDENG_00154390 [Lucifuga dentata]